VREVLQPYRVAFKVVTVLEVLPVGLLFGWLTRWHLRVALQSPARRTSEAWAAFFAGISIFATSVVAVPIGIE